MKRTFLLVALLLSAFSAAQAQSKYDLNGDGSVNVGDVILMLRYLAGWEDAAFCEPFADCDSNGRINARDVIMVMKAIVA